MSESWAHLYPIENTNLPNAIPIHSERFSIGRKTENDLYIPDNAFLSACHCFLTRDPDGDVWITDCSSFGTVINDGQVVNHDTIRLNHNDVMHLVKPKTSAQAHQKVAFRFAIDHLESQDEMKAPEVIIEQEDAHDTQPLDEDVDACQPPSASEPSSPPMKRARSDVPEGALQSEQPLSNPAVAPQLHTSSSDALSKSLECCICKEIMFHIVSVQPCLHSFCAGCLLDWRASGQNDCPTCRGNISSVAKNHLLNEILDKYLTTHPELSRSAEDVASLTDKISAGSSVLFAETSSAEQSPSSDSLPSPFPAPIFTIFPPFLSTFHGNPHSSPFCRSCHPHRLPQSDPAAPGYHVSCNPGAAHVVCACCNYPMPDTRPSSHASSSSATPAEDLISCTICSRLFCYQLYKRCHRDSCIGCLKSLRDVSLQYNYPVHEKFLLRNAYETDILKNYLATHGLSFPQLLQAAMSGLDSGQYAPPPGHPHLRSTSLVCVPCYRTLQEHLVFQFRAALDPSELPPVRPNCRYGHQCRTQRHNAGHAQRYNHICEPILTPQMVPSGVTASTSAPQS